MHHTQNLRNFVRNALLSLSIAGVVGCLCSSNASAQFVSQSTRNSLFPGPPIVGGTPGMQLPPGANNSNNNSDGSSIGSSSGTSGHFSYGYGDPDQHKDPSGLPCVSVNAMSQPQIINPKIYDHLLVIKNTCNQPVGLKLCYYQSTTCINRSIAAYTRRQQQLGISPEADFRFSYTEDFK